MSQVNTSDNPALFIADATLSILEIDPRLEPCTSPSMVFSMIMARKMRESLVAKARLKTFLAYSPTLLLCEYQNKVDTRDVVS